MSNYQNRSGGGGGGNRRGGGGRGPRRGGNGRGRDQGYDRDSNRDRNDHREREPKGDYRPGSDRPERAPRAPQPPAKPLTLWQKILGFLGLGPKAPAASAREPSRHPATRGAASVSSNYPTQPGTSAPANRNDRTDRGERSERPDRAERGDRADRGDRPERAPRPERTERPERKPEAYEVTTEKLYVGNLSFDATESDLQDLFSGAGAVRNTEIVSHKQTQRSKGFGFVTMATVQEAKRAVQELHDKEYMGRRLVVSGAKTPTERSSSNADERDTLEREPSTRREAPAREPEAPAPVSASAYNSYPYAAGSATVAATAAVADTTPEATASAVTSTPEQTAEIAPLAAIDPAPVAYTPEPVTAPATEAAPEPTVTPALAAAPVAESPEVPVALVPAAPAAENPQVPAATPAEPTSETPSAQ